jgi:sortase (surface protein transpeptidase)
VSTLNEIAMNHARMAKEKAAESTELSERHLQIVGSFEVPSIDVQQNVPMHLIAGAQEVHLGHATGFAL